MIIWSVSTIFLREAIHSSFFPSSTAHSDAWHVKAFLHELENSLFVLLIEAYKLDVPIWCQSVARRKGGQAAKPAVKTQLICVLCM